MENSIIDMLKPLFLEAYRRRTWIISAFMAINLLALVLGLNWPKLYESYATISVQERNILGRMVEGKNQPGGTADRAKIAREVILGRGMMTKVLRETGKIEGVTDPKALETSIANMRARTTVSYVGTRNTNLIKISYISADPKDAFETTQYLAQFFVSESSADQEKESQQAFQFIDSQVQEYEKKQKSSEEQLKDFRASNEAVTPGAEAEARRRINQLRTAIAETEQELKEVAIKERSLQAQLAGESDSAVTSSQAQQYQIRRAELKQRLDALRLTYHDTYPDILHVKAQIEELDQMINNLAQGGPDRQNRSQEAVGTGLVAQELKKSLYDARIEVKTLQSRLSDTKEELAGAMMQAKAIPDAEARLAELTREYEVTKRIYEDLLRRREIARVSMNLDLEKQGLALHIDEPAFYPYLPTGPRFWHFLAAGFFLGWLVPLAVIFFLLQLRQKVRLLPHIPERTGLPVMGSIPHLPTPREVRVSYAKDITAISMVLLTLAAVGLVSALRFLGKI